ncbi:MAG TPA: hypothetical protein VI056_10995 [Candidatus Limnocylindria bacterium]
MSTITDPSVTLRRGDLAFRPATLDDAAFAATSRPSCGPTNRRIRRRGVTGG